MKKFKYLLSLLILLEGSFRKRCSILKEINEAIEQRLHEGENINEAINSVGNVYEIISEYDNNFVVENYKNNIKIFFYIVICIILMLLIIIEIIMFKNGVFSMGVMTASNSSVFIASKSNLTFCIAMIIIELVLLVLLIKKIVQHYICNKNMKEE